MICLCIIGLGCFDCPCICTGVPLTFGGMHQAYLPLYCEEWTEAGPQHCFKVSESEFEDLWKVLAWYPVLDDCMYF